MSDSAIRDGAILSARSTRMSWRNLDALITAVMLPVIILVFFVYLFGGAIDTGTAYVDYVAPSVILLCTCLGASTTAVSVSLDLTHGVVDRFRAMDVSGFALLGGHVVASVARNAISTALVFAAASLIGFRPNATPLAWLGVAGLLGLFVLAISWLAAALGLLVKSPEAANGARCSSCSCRTRAVRSCPSRRCRPGWPASPSISQPHPSSRRCAGCCSARRSARAGGWRLPGALASSLRRCSWPACCTAGVRASARVPCGTMRVTPHDRSARPPRAFGRSPGGSPLRTRRPRTPADVPRGVLVSMTSPSLSTATPAGAGDDAAAVAGPRPAADARGRARRPSRVLRLPRRHRAGGAARVLP